MTLGSRRQFVHPAPAVLGGSVVLSACTPSADADNDNAVAAQPGWLGALGRLEGVALSLERVRDAALARSSHNTHCWKFSVADKAITILPDLSRRTPSVNPDERHRP